MSSDINRVTLIGRLTKDPELKNTPAGTSVANLSLASNRTWTQNSEKKEQTSFFNCIAWGKLGEIICQYCKKGQRIGVEGRLQQRSWDDKDGNKRSAVEVVIDNFQFLDSKQENSGAVNRGQTEGHEAIKDDSNPFDDDSIPF